MAGGQEVDGFALDTEIGLFAMKREAVAKAMAPYAAANIEVDIIQLAPIAIYNYIAHDVAKMLPEGEESDVERRLLSTRIDQNRHVRIGDVGDVRLTRKLSKRG